MKTIALVVNPFASRVTEERTHEIERVLSRGGDRVTTLLTEHPGHAVELAREGTGRADALVVFSGDGGFNEVLNGVDGSRPVGFVPGGGTSVLSRALGLPRDPLDAALQIAGAVAAGRTRRISLGRVNGRRFGFGAGVGIDAELVRRVDARGRATDGRRPGDVYFVWTLARLLAERRGRLEPALEIMGVGRAALAFVANADPYTFLGRRPVRLVPDAGFELGLDVVAPVSLRGHEVLRLLGGAVLSGLPRGAANIVRLHDVEGVELVCDRPMPLQVDGEDLGDVERAVFTVEREALDVLV